MGKLGEKIVCQIRSKLNHSAAIWGNKYEYYCLNEEVPQALVTLNVNDLNSQNFYADSRATSYISNDPGKLNKISTYNGNDKIFVRNGQSLQTSHVVDISLNNAKKGLKLKNVLIVPKIKKNLLSIGQLADNYECKIEFDSLGFVVKTQENQILARGSQTRQLVRDRGKA